MDGSRIQKIENDDRVGGKARGEHILSLGDNNFLFALNFLLSRNSENLES